MPVFEPKTDITTRELAGQTGWKCFKRICLPPTSLNHSDKGLCFCIKLDLKFYNIFTTLPNTGGEHDYQKAVGALTKHFEPDKNQIFEIYNFRQATQKTEETIDEFHTRLRTLAKNCTFHDDDFEIKMQIVCNGKISST